MASKVFAAILLSLFSTKKTRAKVASFKAACNVDSFASFYAVIPNFACSFAKRIFLVLEAAAGLPFAHGLHPFLTGRKFTGCINLLAGAFEISLDIWTRDPCNGMPRLTIAA